MTPATQDVKGLRTLVTGGAGFIGSHLVDELVARGAEVTALDDLSTGRAENLNASIEAGVKLVEGTVMDAGVVDKLVSRHELVFHLAAAVGVRHIVEEPLGSILTNVRGTEHVLEAAHKHGRRVLLASTSEVYGSSDKVPFREDGPRVLGPTWIHRWSYSTAKALDEHLAFAYAERGLLMSVVRYFNSYGPRIDESGYGSVVARFASQALAGVPLTVHGDGLQTRSFTFVSDTVAGTIAAATDDRALGRVFNIGTADEITIMALAERVVRAAASTSTIELVPYSRDYPTGFQDTRRRVADTSLARSVLGFAPQVPLDEGLAKTIEWCRSNYALAGTT